MGKLQFGPALKRGWQIFTKDPLNLILGAIIAGVLSLTIVLAPAMSAGYFYLTRRVAMGEQAELGDVFHGFNDFGRYLLGGIIFLLAMIPAYLLSLATAGLGVIASAVIVGLLLPFWPLMVDRGLSAPDAFKEGIEFYKREYLAATIIALLFIVALLFIARTLEAVSFFVGVLIFFVASPITAPLTAAIMLATYEQCYGYREEAESVREAKFEVGM